MGRQIKDLEQAQDARVSALEKAAASFDEWRPSIEGTVDDIRLEVKKISLGWECASIAHPEDKSGVFAVSPAATQRRPLSLRLHCSWLGPALQISTGRVDLGLFQP